MDDRLFYKPSGRFSPAAPFLMLAAGIPAGLLMGAIYGALDFYSPIIYLNAVALAAIGWVLGVIVLKIARAAHLRNALLAAACGAVAGLAALYAGWVAWIFVLGGRTSDVLLLDPRDLVQAGQQISQVGAWSLGSSGTPVTGVMLKSIWAVEALVLVGFATVWPALQLSRMPYSEKTNQWADQTEELPPLAAIAAADRKAFKASLRGGEFEALGRLKPAQEGGDAFTICTGRMTDPPGDEVFLTLETVDISVNKKGETQVTKTCLARNMIVDPAAWGVIRGIAESDAAGTGPRGGGGGGVDGDDEPVRPFPGLGPAAETAPQAKQGGPGAGGGEKPSGDHAASPHGLPGMPPPV